MKYNEVLNKMFNLGIKKSSFAQIIGMEPHQITRLLKEEGSVDSNIITDTIGGIEELIDSLQDIIKDLEQCYTDSDEQCYMVYELVFPDGKLYYGMTYRPSVRWDFGFGYKDQLVGKAIQEVGWSNIKHNIIASNLTKTAARKIEKSLITETHSNLPSIGYNVYR